MENSVIIAGFGGQGVILAGKILAQAGMEHGLEVTWLPSYGPEMRGGTANCTVVISEEAIGSPIVDEPSALIALNLPSLDKFEPKVKKNGVIIVNSSLISRRLNRDDVNSFSLDLNAMAADLGNTKAINTLSIGAYIKATGFLPLARVQEAMERMLRQGGKEKFIPINKQAIEQGYNAV